jgi:hypothetical protein
LAVGAGNPPAVLVLHSILSKYLVLRSLNRHTHTHTHTHTHALTHTHTHTKRCSTKSCHTRSHIFSCQLTISGLPQIEHKKEAIKKARQDSKKAVASFKRNQILAAKDLKEHQSQDCVGFKKLCKVEKKEKTKSHKLTIKEKKGDKIVVAMLKAGHKEGVKVSFAYSTVVLYYFASSCRRFP